MKSNNDRSLGEVKNFYAKSYAISAPKGWRQNNFTFLPDRVIAVRACNSIARAYRDV